MMKFYSFLLAFLAWALVAIVMISCGTEPKKSGNSATSEEQIQSDTSTAIEKQTNEVKMAESHPLADKIKTFTLTNEQGNDVKITNFGAKVMSIVIPDRQGNKSNVVLGYDSAWEYLNGNLYFGAIIGRYANRIAHGEFELDQVKYQLNKNNGPNHLHGGPDGFHNVIWEARQFQNDEDDVLELTYESKDGEEGYPGKLTVKVVYTWTNRNELMIDYEAKTDKKTVVNLTHHSFFNLLDGGKSSITNHKLMLNAESYLPVDSTLIPTGEIAAVSNTPMDFRVSRPIGEFIQQPYPQLIVGKGYDHNFVLDYYEDSMILAAEVYEPVTGRVMHVYTDQPGMQFYSGNFLDGTDIGHENTKYKFRSAFCLEAQHFPVSPNQLSFPTTIPEPGESYTQSTIYEFSTDYHLGE